ncbi:MAG: hypothetical protein ACP5G6_08005 [Conexivisphaera sp.]
MSLRARTKFTPPMPPALDEEQRRELVEVLVRGAEGYGFETDIWTTERVARGDAV